MIELWVSRYPALRRDRDKLAPVSLRRVYFSSCSAFAKDRSAIF
ncbi:MAG TPA: hypothetical protein VK668_24400 [Mucilaginibacter sp.]|nr:hypothetical protein [Mucilaginibacter sp.]